MVSNSLSVVTILVAIFSYLVLSDAQTNIFGFKCSRADSLCGANTCDIDTQACVCPTDGKTYNYACVEEPGPGVCTATNVYGSNCDIPRVGVYCVAGKMFLNVLTHGGNAKFGGSMYIKGKQDVQKCNLQEATTAQPFQDKEKEYGLENAASMEGYYLELSNTDADCGDATADVVAATADVLGYTMYTREFYIQYNPSFQASLDQFVKVQCKQTSGATSTDVYVGLGQVSSADDSTKYDQVNVESEVGVVSLELLDSSLNPITTAIALGTEIILRFNLGSDNEYKAIWLSGCKANNSLPAGENFKEIELIDDTGCPKQSAVGVFKSFPSKPAVQSGQPQVILMSIGAFRFTGSSDQVSFQCTVNLCKDDADTKCNPPAGCAGFKSTAITLPSTTPVADLTSALTADQNNPLGTSEAVTLTCSGAGGTSPLEYSIREQGDTTTPIFATENTKILPTGTVGIKTYVCEVKDAAGTIKTSDPVTLQYVDTLTAILTATPKGDVTVNTNVDLSCKAAGGTGPYTYVIQEGGQPVSALANHQATSDVVGEKTYKCVATDTGNVGVTADSLDLKINFIAAVQALTATLTSDNRNPVNTNEDVILTCSATGGDGTYTYEILGGTGTTPLATTSTFTVNLADPKTESYTCKVTDGTSATADSNTISVTTVSTLTAQVYVEPSGPVVKGTQVTLICKAAGFTTGTLTYSWSRAGVPDFNTNVQLVDTSADAGTVSYGCTVTLDGVAPATSSVDVVFTEPARKRRSAVNIRFKRGTEDSEERVSGYVKVYDPNAPTDGQVQLVNESQDCVNKSDVTMVIIILSVFLFLLLVIATILGAMVLRSRQKVAGMGHKDREFESPVHTMSMPRLAINSSGYGSSVGSHGV
ncbi:hypothetical protein EGW08_008743 [Elysia chlorotica]|uniref:Ig-like domain-containing protein n=1 Tax=Elysia chlorotica TaxID=188477 RepID=A0A433TPG2_ELYCH|nr:hypothetical protein EGW08_008743 [Elysia chlorotica]